MNLIIVKNSLGEVVAFGRNDGNYAPFVADGDIKTVGTKADIAVFADPVLQSRKQEIMESLS